MRVAGFLLMLVVAVVGIHADEPTVTATPGVSHVVVEARVPGVIIHHVVERRHAEHELLLFVGPAIEPILEEGSPIPPCADPETTDTRSLYRFSPSGDGRIEKLYDDIPSTVRRIDTYDLDGDGVDEILYLTDDRTLVRGAMGLGPLPSVDTTLRRARVFEATLGTAEPDDRPLVAVELGQLEIYERQDGAVLRSAEVPLPIKSHRLPDGWVLSSPHPRLLERREDGALLFAATPEVHGKTRVQAQLLQVAADGTSSVLDSWSRLPAPEEVMGQSYLMIDEQPHMLISTRSAEKLSMFGEKSLRLFPVKHDRSRLGRPPLFAVESRMNLWQPGEPTMVDVNGDGREDLVIGYWKGLRKSRLVLDAYLRNSGGGFSIAPRTTTLDPKDGDRSFVQYGHDLTGDDLADLVVRTEEHLLVYVGRSSKSGKNVVEPTPIEIPWQYGRPDEPFEVIITGNGVDSLDRNVSTTRPDVVALDDARPAQILAVFFGKEDLAGWARVVRLQVNN